VGCGLWSLIVMKAQRPTNAQSPEAKDPRAQRPEPRACLVDIVLKLGGGLLAHPAHLETVLAAIGDAAHERRLLIVPGGGPFAETVRQVDREFTLSDDAAHWMAVLAMDQYAHVITARLADSALVADVAEIGAALAAAHVPVLAPSRWLRDADPLPHTWDVTSDSIAAWIAGVVGAGRVVLVKPPRRRQPPRIGATGFGAASPGQTDEVDAYFHRALPAHVTPVIVPADETDALRAALRM